VTSVWEQRLTQLVAEVTQRRESKALELLPDLMPVLSVLDPASPELYDYRGEDLCWGVRNQPAVAGQRSSAGLRNPTGSGMLVVVTGGQFSGSVGTLFLSTAPISLSGGGPVAGVSRNRRASRIQAAAGSSVATLSIDARIGGIGNQAYWRFPGTTGTLPCPVVLGPGQELWVEGDTDNTSLTASWAWFERPTLTEL
jgi:hypothetical protein